MATLRGQTSGAQPKSITLSAGQSASAPSTNVLDRGGMVGPSLLTIVSTVGATPTVLTDIQGSVDNADWWNIPYADVSAPTTILVAQLAAITTATTLRKILPGYYPWRYMRLLYTANTNVTITATVVGFPG